ncbi:MAG: protein-L-isoaspartate(D-aspartate) O-methyltransferase [Deltaproteobacteria bacterium]|nr:protein-L-isoaspartate(D-aspartate) O-methyltransferase [Deltaproteobacteria bacterium]
MTRPPKTSRALSVALLAYLVAAPAPAEAPRADERDRMVDAVAAQVRGTRFETGWGELAPRVAAALREVPRHAFVPAAARGDAYENRPLPIGYGQTISQPYIVAIMTELLDPEPGDVVFELGTGSGYQAAVLSRLVREVYTIEIVEPLGKRSRATLDGLGYRNVKSKVGDGYDGWPEAGPFDAIIVTAAADHVPPPLVAQLKPGGRMIIPVGGPFMTQYLTLVDKDAEGRVHARQILPVRFVPLTRKR